MNKKPILFIADLHLDPANLAMCDKFLSFLHGMATEAKALYILGDLFESWIGDDDQSECHQTIIRALKQLSATGVAIYLMHGNRDFLLGKRFVKESGCQLINDPYPLMLYDTASLLMHGDLLCSSDSDYMRYRRKARNPIIQYLFLTLPLAWRRRIAKKMRQRSQQHLSKVPDAIMDIGAGEDEKVLNQYHSKLLIHGHTHRPAIHPLADNKTRIVLDAWHQKGNVLICQADENHRLTYEMVYF